MFMKNPLFKVSTDRLVNRQGYRLENRELPSHSSVFYLSLWKDFHHIKKKHI